MHVYSIIDGSRFTTQEALLHWQLNTIKLSFPQAKRDGNPSEELRTIPDKPTVGRTEPPE
jgi:hypothetical protein